MYGLQDWGLYSEILRRLLIAAACGIAIGWERDLHGRSAGLRTHMLVALGSAMFTQLSLITAICPLPFVGSENVHGDVCRIAAQIVSGIGFLGAGTIVKEGFTIKGLTTAACLWFSAAVGMAERAADDNTAEFVFRRADKAMYLDKERFKKEHGIETR